MLADAAASAATGSRVPSLWDGMGGVWNVSALGFGNGSEKCRFVPNYDGTNVENIPVPVLISILLAVLHSDLRPDRLPKTALAASPRRWEDPETISTWANLRWRFAAKRRVNTFENHYVNQGQMHWILDNTWHLAIASQRLPHRCQLEGMNLKMSRRRRLQCLHQSRVDLVDSEVGVLCSTKPWCETQSWDLVSIMNLNWFKLLIWFKICFCELFDFSPELVLTT